MNIGALRSAFKNALLNFSRVPARRPVVLLRVSVMGGSKRSFSKLAKPTSLIAAEKMDNKFKGLSGERQANSLDVAAAKLLEIQHIQDDPAKIEGMTVQELRTILRNIGVPAKGRKSELVSALKCFMDRHLYGESSQGVEEHISSKSAGNVPQQREFGIVSDERSLPTTISLSEVTEIKQTKKRVKENPSGNKIVKVDSEIMSGEKLSLETREVSVNKSSPAKRKISSNTVIEDIKADIVTGPQDESWTVLAHKKPKKDWIPYNPRTMRPAPPSGDTKFLKLMSWNVNGLRALLKLEGFSALELARRENFDVLCLQETKLQEKDVASIKQGLIDGYDNSFWTCSNAKLGYSGTAVVSRIKPLSVRYGLGIPDHDNEGRLVTVEFESFYLINVYVPNSGDGLKRLPYRITQWDLYLSNYMKELEKSKPVILTGDLNCAHQEIDIYNPAGNRRSAGFTDEERQSFGTNFLSRGFVDTFRRQHPNVVGYTYWGYRHGGRKTNKGWRLDYFLASESIADMVHDSYIVPDVYGSDHCPIGLILKL